MNHRPAFLSSLSLLSALALSPLALAQDPPADDGVFVEGSRYSAVLHPGAGAWRLMRLDGDTVRLQVPQSCHAGDAPPPGLWLLTRDAADRPQLLAFSSTPLPADHPGEVALVPCDQPLPEDRPALAVPDALVDWLGQHSGAIYVTR
ncbi:MAG TPA: hypothetical protein VKZ64_08090 [Arenimonas sp.]|jgi:hypothetical protein|nr:hypothetical protein [Arenimonas sp.]